MHSWVYLLVLACILFLAKARGSLSIVILVLSFLLGILSLMGVTGASGKEGESFLIYLLILWMCAGFILIQNNYKEEEKDL